MLWRHWKLLFMSMLLSSEVLRKETCTRSVSAHYTEYFVRFSYQLAAEERPPFSNILFLTARFHHYGLSLKQFAQINSIFSVPSFIDKYVNRFQKLNISYTIQFSKSNLLIKFSYANLISNAFPSSRSHSTIANSLNYA